MLEYLLPTSWTRTRLLDAIQNMWGNELVDTGLRCPSAFLVFLLLNTNAYKVGEGLLRDNK